ncbi:hypothetical protein MTO96_014804 [Rhipicephalus appendiculatus]
MTRFRPRLSAQDSVLDLLSHIEHHRASGLSTLAVFMDVAKAYDCVLQTGIINGLQGMGLFGEEFNVRNMNGFLGKCLFMAYAAAVVALIIVPNEAEGIPGFIIDAILKAGRTEEEDKK